MRGVVRDAMSVRSPRLDAGTSIAAAAQQLVMKDWTPMPVVGAEGEVRGVLAPHDVVRGVAQGLDVTQTPVEEIAGTELATVAAGDPLNDARAAMERTGQPMVLVTEDSRLLGTLTVTDLQGHTLIESELRDAAAHVVREVAPGDLMYTGSWGAYAYAGVSAVQCIRSILGKLIRPDPASILDLPCGHGRELRFLKLAYPDAEFGVCDVDEDGVEYCARVFGGHPTVSDDDPAKVAFDRRYELAWSGSLFTHLSAERWPGFLDLFARAMEPGGLVLFTTNAFLPASMLSSLGLGPSEVEQILDDFKRSRFGYVDVGDGNWGLALARPGWVKEQIERSPLELVSYERGAWKPPVPAQDVVVCTLK
jgi:CBS domain-containing protein